MADELVVAPEAEGDVLAAYAWYEAQRAGLGEEFLTRVDACLQGIMRSPERNRPIYINYRRALVRKFPYAVFYEHTAGTVIVYSILHTSRDPNKWRQRLP
jgi:plasmid stabilization system protein ParE